MRELENIVQRAIILSTRDVITTKELPLGLKQMQNEPVHASPLPSQSLPEQVERLEKELVMEALRVTGGNQSKAAERLGLSERNLRYKLKKWGVK
jgi:two-component system NtrC family response regulator